MSKKLTIITPIFSYGGLEIFILDIASALAERGCQIDLVVLKKHQSENCLQNRSPLNKNINIIRLNASKGCLSFFKLFKYFVTSKPEVVLSVAETPNILNIISSLILFKPFKVFIRIVNTLSVEAGRKSNISDRYIKPFLVKLLYRFADGIVAPSNGVKQDLEQSFKLKKVRTIVNPVPSYLKIKVEEPVTHDWYQDKKEPVIVSGGRLCPQKDFATLITAFDKVLKQKKAKLVILGEGEDKPKIEQQIKELSLENDVALIGFQENPFKWFAKADVFAFSSFYEGMPNILVQALGCGCPSVATDCPSGPSELIQDGVNGFLTPIGDANKMAENILKILNGKFDRTSVQKTIEKHNIDNIANEYLNFIGLC